MSAEELAQNKKDWSEIGFHRPLGGLLYNLLIIFIAAGFGIVLSVYVIPNFIIPFPEALGMVTITTSIFGFYFTLLDLGIGNAIQRFVAEENVKSPKTAIQYIQFFIWYQMFSGLCQVTVIALWVFFVVPRSELVYASWFFLLYSTVQYPGMLGIFRGTLEAYQQYHKASLIYFIQTQVFENILRIIFILLGRWWGAQNPAIGEVMGATMGSIIGTYLREFLTALIAAYWVAPIMREVDPTYSISFLFHIDFNNVIIKKCLLFGVKAMLPGLISPVAYMISTMMNIAWLSSYASILGMYNIGEMLGHMVTTFNFSGIGASFAESYLNKKYKLTQYYFQSIYKWLGLFGFFMIGLLFYGAELINVIIGSNYSYVMLIIQNFLFLKLALLFSNHMNQFLNGIGKPEYAIYLAIAEECTRLFVLFIMLVVIPSGWMALVYSVGMGWVVRWIAGLILFHRKVLPVKINLWQTFGASIISAIVQAGFIKLGIIFLLPIFTIGMGKIVGAVLVILIGIVGSVFLYFAIYSFAGGWDDGQLKVFQRSKEMAGPSKFIIKILHKISYNIARISPLTNKFPIDDTGVFEEIQELRILQEQGKKTALV